MESTVASRIPLVAIMVAAAVAVVLFDSLAASVSVITGINYEFFFVGSVLIYALAGAVTYRFAGGSLGSAALVALAVGIADATLGWWVSWSIGPGRPTFPMTPLLLTMSASFTACIATATGAVGAVIARALVR
jgi:hypothetical protein